MVLQRFAPNRQEMTVIWAVDALSLGKVFVNVVGWWPAGFSKSIRIMTNLFCSGFTDFPSYRLYP